MIDMGSAFCVVKERAIYAIQLADEENPARTNVTVPNTQQRVIDTNNLGLGQKVRPLLQKKALF